MKRITKTLAWLLLMALVILNLLLFVGCASKKKTVDRTNKKEKFTVESKVATLEAYNYASDSTSNIFINYLGKTETHEMDIRPVNPDKLATVKETPQEDGGTLYELNNATINKKGSSEKTQGSDSTKTKVKKKGAALKKADAETEANGNSSEKGRDTYSEREGISWGFMVPLIIGAIIIIAILILIKKFGFNGLIKKIRDQFHPL